MVKENAMTHEEADKLAKIFETVDGGSCVSCMNRICREANKVRLGFYWLLEGADTWEPIITAHEGDAPEETL